MYRGSSGLLWKDYKVHNDAIEIIKNYYQLRQEYFSELPKKQLVFDLFNELSTYYSKQKYFKGIEEHKVTPTDTLIFKIILGTLGCLPAFDRYFNIGLFKKENAVVNMIRSNMGNGLC